MIIKSLLHYNFHVVYLKKIEFLLNITLIDDNILRLP